VIDNSPSVDDAPSVTQRIQRLSGGLGANYWRVWSSSAASNLADGVFWIAFPLLAIRLTDEPVLIAGVTVVGRLPWLVFVLFAGALADRLDRRRTMISVAALRTIVSAVLAVGVFADVVGLPVLYATALLLGIAETLFDTAAQSIMPTVVDKDRLSVANSRLYAVELTMNQFVGPPLGGLLASIAIGLAFAGSAVAYVVGVVALFFLTGAFRPVRSADVAQRSIFGDIRDGLDYLFHHRLLRTLALMVGVMNLASSAVFAIFVLFAVEPGPMGLSEFGFGVLTSALAIGSLVGSFLTPMLERRLGRARLLLVSVLASGLVLVVPGLTANPWIVGAAFSLSGITLVAWNIVTVSLRQRIVPDQLLGRLNASYRLLAWGTQPIGALLGGILAQAFGLQVTFLIAGVSTLVLLPGFLTIVTDRVIDAAEREGTPEAPAPEVAVPA
jgi:MFS family permease